MSDDVKIDIRVAATLFHHKRYDDALLILDYLLQQNPQDEKALYLTAAVYASKGDNEKAIPFFEKTVSRNSRHFEAYNNLGVALEELKRFDRAEQAYRSALAIKADYWQASFHLANLLHKSKRLPLAEQQYLATLELNPSDVKTLNNLGNLYMELNQAEKAQDILENAHRLHPTDTAVMVNLGQVYLHRERLKEAIDVLTQATTLPPVTAEAFNNLGLAYLGSGDFEKALYHFTRAIELNAHYSDAYSNLGLTYQKLNDFTNAERSYAKAVDINPSNINAWTNFGYLYVKSDNATEALRIFHVALIKDPTNPEVHFHLAQIYLAQGDFLRGWDHYRFRGQIRIRDAIIPTQSLPIDLTGKRVLLQHDQGIGDELFFLRFAPEIAKRGGSLVYIASKKFAPVLKACTSINVITKDDAQPPCDYFFSVSDLPFLVGMTDLAQLPPPLPLTLDPEIKARIATTLRQMGPPPYIAVAWRAGIQKRNKLHKDIPLALLGDLLKPVEGTIISVQRGSKPGETVELARYCGKPVADFSAYNDDLMNMLGLLANSDIFIGVSNTNIHLLASLGKSASVFVPFPPEWRWLQSGNVSPWFANMRLFRQGCNDDWHPAFTELAKQLNALGNAV